MKSTAVLFTGSDAEALIVRDKEVYDGALPSGNGVLAVQLSRLGRLTGDLSLHDQAAKCLLPSMETSLLIRAAIQTFSKVC
ncbi:hypothetical protein PO124_30765 [Bacillus licheniformis]|nr:hypothetical protein [Bacillus licheniformis]